MKKTVAKNPGWTTCLGKKCKNKKFFSEDKIRLRFCKKCKAANNSVKLNGIKVCSIYQE